MADGESIFSFVKSNEPFSIKILVRNISGKYGYKYKYK
jgi:hypothetical protein